MVWVNVSSRLQRRSGCVVIVCVGVGVGVYTNKLRMRGLWR